MEEISRQARCMQHTTYDAARRSRHSYANSSELSGERRFGLIVDSASPMNIMGDAFAKKLATECVEHGREVSTICRGAILQICGLDETVIRCTHAMRFNLVLSLQGGDGCTSSTQLTS